MIEFAFSIFKNRLARLWPIVLHLQYSWLYGNIWKFVGLQLKWCHISDKQHNVERLAACNPDWQELNNGRLAMLAFSGMVHHNLVPGTSITCGVYRSWNTIMGTNIWSCTSKGQTKMWTYHEVEDSPKISPKNLWTGGEGSIVPTLPRRLGRPTRRVGFSANVFAASCLTCLTCLMFEGSWDLDSTAGALNSGRLGL